MILKALTWGPMHGYAVAGWIERVTDDVLRLGGGSVYPAPPPLEEGGLVTAAWGVSDNNGRAKFYRLTPQGRQHLRAESSSWSRYADAVRKVLQAAEHPAAGRA